MIKIELLSPYYEDSYTDMLRHCDEAMFSHSIPYRNLLFSFLNCEPYYLIAIGGSGEVVGAIPAFLKRSKSGNVLNSLPFFGSHGGVLVNSWQQLDEQTEVQRLLLEAFMDIAEEKNCILSVISTPPLGANVSVYDYNLPKFNEGRVAQMVKFRDNILDADLEIMNHIIDPDSRRTIRRPFKHGITSEPSTDFTPLFEMHDNNMSSKGGSVKPIEFFQRIKEIVPQENYSLTYAKREGEIIAGLLVFLFKDTVEYFTPALKYEYSIEQGTSLLIYEEMKRAIERGYRYFNFGGTLGSQESLHRFKARWGAKDYRYYYYIYQHQDIGHILEMKPQEILDEYKWFYVVPFGGLTSGEQND